MELEPLTAIVGPNGAGKTAVLEAIDILLGPRWPTLGRIRDPEDFTGFDTAQQLVIQSAFDPPFVHTDALKTNRDIEALRFSCRPYKKSGKWGDAGDLRDEFEPLDRDGKTPRVAITPARKGAKPQFRPLRVSRDLRDHARVLFIGQRRDVLSHRATRRGSALAQLLGLARKEFERDVTAQQAFSDRYEQAMNAIRTPKMREIESTIEATTRRTLGFLGKSMQRRLDVGLGIADPANPYASLRLECREQGMVLPAETMGMGIQSALVVAIFDALRQIGEDIGTVLIEEPEMYLHPQAQRYFYKLLLELAETDRCQVIYTTHSPVFADLTRFEGVRLMRREPGSGAAVGSVTDADDRSQLKAARNRLKLRRAFDTATSEALFARRVLLVEGTGDRLGALYVAERLGEDLDAEDLAVVECGSKSSIPFYAHVCTALGIPFVVLHDEDVREVPEGEHPEPAKAKDSERENERERERNAEIREAVGDAQRLFLLSPSLEEALGIGRGAKDKPRRVVEELEDLEHDNLPQPLIEAVRALTRE